MTNRFVKVEIWDSYTLERQVVSLKSVGLNLMTGDRHKVHVAICDALKEPPEAWEVVGDAAAGGCRVILMTRSPPWGNRTQRGIVSTYTIVEV